MFKKKKIKYEADSNGCWNCTSHSLDSSGYPRAVINGKRLRLSRYMYEQKHGSIPEGMVIRHKCDNPCCINPDHLEIGTQTDNMHDMVERGRRKSTHGVNNPKAKLSDTDVIDILNKHKNGERQVDIAKKYNVSKHCIFGIVHQRNWKQKTNKENMEAV
jgi:hypothetical protein